MSIEQETELRKDFDTLRRAFAELIAALPDGEGYEPYVDGGYNALRALDKKYPMPTLTENNCEHDICFEGESSDHSKGFFFCSKCGVTGISFRGPEKD